MPDQAPGILLLLLVTNGAPILTARLLGSWGDTPVDLGWIWRDGHALFGSSKTWRGLVAALLAGVAGGVYLGFGAHFGLVFGLLVAAGDLVSSFFKRRKGLAPSDQSLGLDQLPEAFLPAVYGVWFTGIAWWWVILLPLAFMVIELVVSRPLYWLKIRKRPY